MSRAYAPQILLACAFTSVSIHLLNQRREAQAECLRHIAQVGALEDALQRLQAGETVSDAELSKIRRRVGLTQKADTRAGVPAIPAMDSASGWKDSFAKRKETLAGITDEQIVSEWNEGKFLVSMQRREY